MRCPVPARCSVAAAKRSPEHVAFGAALRAARLRANLTLKALEERTGVGFSYISAVEQGSRNASLQVVFALCEALDVPLSRLVADYEHALAQAALRRQA